MSIWRATVGDEYKNPILCADYSDPDVIRVGDDFYIIASSFTYVPGVPVLHSTDLVNWELISYCVRRLPFERYDRPVHGCGTWAPSLRYHDSRFYAFIPMPDEGIFVATAENPAGEWTPLRCIKTARGWIDPCPLWDDDGRAYMAFAYANSRCGIKHKLSVVEIDPVTCDVIGEPVLVFDGTLTAPTVEGPKLYKRNGWYYIFAPAGGVPTGWQLVLRGRSVYGPYESRIVLHQGDTQVNGPHQGGWVALQDGRDFFMHFQDAGPMGRIIHLQPMCWQNDWPSIGVEQNGDGIGEPVARWCLPFPERAGECHGIVQDDDFLGDALALHWQFQCNPDSAWYDCMTRSDAVRLFCKRNPDRDENPLWFAGNAMTQIPQAPDFDVTLTLTLCPEREGDMAGLGVIGHRYGYRHRRVDRCKGIAQYIRKIGWNLAWSAAYTMDANVNLQVSGMNIGEAPEAAVSYCQFVKRQIPDWEENAYQVYGMRGALLTPVNTDGRRAMMVEYDSEYPFEYWNAGAAWMALPVFETWQCFGDLQMEDGERIVEDLLRPLLRKTLNFWIQLCNPVYFTDVRGKARCQSGKTALEAGERFLLIPGYSPENHPGGKKCALAMNTSMDIAAARDCLRMVRALERACPLPDSASVLAACDDLEKGLPDYRLDGTGALKEWACDFYDENNAHRHLSHLYGAWPAFETRGSEDFVKACVRAVENRDRENAGRDDTPSHGWIHKLLILTRLKMGDMSARMMNRLLSTDVFYATGMTDHNTDRCRAVFCTDTLLGLLGVVQEMLLYSDDQRIEPLPSLPGEWRRGEARGFRLRSGGLVKYLQWNMDEGIVQMRMVPGRAAVLEIRFREDWKGSLAIDNIGEKSLRPDEKIAFSENAEYDFVWKANSGKRTDSL